MPTVIDDITAMRDDVDKLDKELAMLIIRRRVLSQSLQRVKVIKGEPLTDLSRERDVLANYQRMLGEDGNRLGADILAFCKKAQVH